MTTAAELSYWPEHRLIGWFPAGRLDKVRIMDYFQALQDCPWGASANRFCDFSMLDGFDLDYADVAQLAESRKRNLGAHIGILLVICSSHPLGFGFGRMYESAMEDCDIRIAVLDNTEDSAALLGVEAALLRRSGKAGP